MGWRIGAFATAALLVSVAVARMAQDPQSGTATWDASRAAGFASYLLLWAATVSGIGLHLRYRPVAGPLTWVLESHRMLSVLALSFLASHVVALVLDPVVSFPVVDAVVPFTSGYRPVQVGLGVLGQWLLLVVLASTAFATAMSWAAWRSFHYLAFPCYVLALVHGVTAGSDSSSFPAVMIYAVTAGSVGALLVARMLGRGWTEAAEA